jgi:hypothetical protein
MVGKVVSVTTPQTTKHRGQPQWSPPILSICSPNY